MHGLKKLISVLLALEGIFHFVFPTISIIGMVHSHTWNWMIALTPVADLFFGCVCVLGSYLLGQKHHHH